MQVVLVHNPVSGRGRALVHARMLQQALERAGHGVVSVASAATDAHDWLAPRMDQAQALLVVGGDGTVRSVAQVGAESGVPLVHVPMGTENLVARCMQMRKAVPDVLNTLEHGRAVQVDLAMVNGEPMLLMVSAGIDAQVVAWVADQRESAITRWIYVRGLLSQLPRHVPGTVHARVDGEVVVDGAQGWLIIANSPDYGARFDPVPHARMDDGRLDLLFLPGTRPRHMVQWALRSRLRRHLSHGEAVVASGRTMDVRFDGATPIQIDGDQPWGACRVDTLTVAMAPDKLTVLLPPWARQVRALSQSLHADSTSAALG